MIRILLIRFWPVWLPVALYLLWYVLARRRARKAGQPAPRLHEGPWVWTALCMAGLALACALFYGVFEDENRGEAYVPAHVEDGRIVPGRIGGE